MLELGMAKIAKKKSPGGVATKRGGARASKGEFSRVKILSSAVKPEGDVAKTIRNAVRNYYKRSRALEKL
jgi:hypothetical protein